jgi:predicted dehydrogenase
MAVPSLKAAIVGCGKIADAHVEQIRAIGGVEVVAVCDSEPLMARQLGTRFGVERQYGNFREMLDRVRPDAVHITTPPGSHLQLATEAVQAGCHVFIEKPLALDAAAGRAILDAARAARRKVAINHWYNFDPPGVLLQEMVHDGILGDPVHVESTLGYDLSGDYGAAVLGDQSHWVHRLPGKLFHNVLDHVVSKIALFLPDAEPRVTTLDYRRRAPSGDRVLDAVADELRFLLGGETVSAYGLISAHARPAGHSLRVYGTRNTICVDYNNRTVTLESEQKYPSMLGRLLPAFAQARQYRRAARRNLKQFWRADFHYFQGMRRLLALFYESIRTDGVPPIPYDEILRVARLIDLVIGDLKQTLSDRATAAGERAS